MELLTEVIDEIYESFLISAVLAGKVHIPGFWAKKDVCFAHEWVMVGVFKLPKSGEGAIEMGTAVHFDGIGITATAAEGTTTPAGYAAAPSEASDKFVLVKLPG